MFESVIHGPLLGMLSYMFIWIMSRKKYLATNFGFFENEPGI